MTVLAFECYADQDVYLFLRDHLKLPLKKLHSWKDDPLWPVLESKPDLTAALARLAERLEG